MSEFKSMNVRLLMHIYIQKKFLFFSWDEFIGHWVTNVISVRDNCADLKMICNLELKGCFSFMNVVPCLNLPNLVEAGFIQHDLSDNIGTDYILLPFYVKNNGKYIDVKDSFKKKGSGRIIFKIQQIIPA